jgi:nucleotide-binding universal stress UspA family protein
MFKHILVPLDGSRLAEAALPPAVHLAQTLDASTTLLHVVERKAPQEVHGERHLVTADEAKTYLKEVATRAFTPGLRVTWHVHTCETEYVAGAVVEHIAELAPDLIVMSTHGQGGLRALVYGNIAQQIIASSSIPILLVRSSREKSAAAFVCRRLLVPLDGKPEHEQGLLVAFGLAQACAAQIDLVMIVHTLSTLPPEQAATARLLPSAMSAWLDLSQNHAEEYLEHWVTRCQVAGLGVTTEVSRGDPATIIVRTARRVKADLTVLGTHGRAGLDAFWAGSVAPQISRHPRVPLLLVPARKPAPAR